MMTEVFLLADRAVEQTAEQDPIGATFMGVAGYDTRLTDYSPAAADSRAAGERALLSELDALPIQGEDDRVAAAVLRERLGARLDVHDSGENLTDCNVLGSPIQAPRQVFSMMATDGEDDWATIAERLEEVPDCLTSVQDAYDEGARRGLVPARRQVLGCATYSAVVSGQSAEREDTAAPWFSTFVSGYNGSSTALKLRLTTASAGATAAYGEMSQWLRNVHAPRAAEADGVGPERYARMARVYTGADLDLTETYAWGWEDLTRITRRMNDCAGRLYGGVTPVEATERLDADPKYTLQGAEQTRDWLQAITDRTIESFDGTYFDIPPMMRQCQAMLAPAGSAAAPYYTPPSEDFSRPGRTWLPTRGETHFRTWWLESVWYHEAVPGHHLQIAYAMLQSDRLSRFQRVEFVSGHGEGWALYAERLMDELGYFDHPATELGFLSAQAMRAARVVLDIGLHLGLVIPADVDPAVLEGMDTDARGSVWNAELARQLLRTRALLPADFAASEVDRYLGIPGQAICYKVGERVWLQAREDAKTVAGVDFDLKNWHMRALSLGSVGLDVLRAELAQR
jgi:uncharacterized protein (DUF885 family)